MQGISDRGYALVRYSNFLGEVLEPACTLASTPLDVGIWQTDERQACAAALAARYKRVDLGLRWGPAWSTAWFRLRGRLSDEQRALVSANDGAYSALRFSSGTEATLWQDGSPARGFDDNRDLLRIEGATKKRLEFHVEAACNMPLGISTFWWDGAEVQARWREENPGRLEAAELVVRDRALEAAVADYRFVVETVQALDAPEDADPRAMELLRLLRCATDELERASAGGKLRANIVSALAPLAEAFTDEDDDRPATTRCHAVGHAHLDTAWLWPMAETRRKAQRSWSNALELTATDPAFRFVATQPQQYEWLREDAPALFERVCAAVASGAWESGGATWIEPDCWAPSAEALARQLLHGLRWQRSTFGPDHAGPGYLFLPDTFGFPACLPQLMRAAGLDSFVTDKLAWSERNEFPHTTFLWRGLDGGSVLAHLTPGTNYNAPIMPTDLLRAERRLVKHDAGPIGPERPFLDRWLQPFGFGDGGGGPTAGQLERAHRTDRTAGLPRVELSTMGAFCDALHGDLRDAAAAGRHAPVWDGELYIENHRGTLTSQAWLKAANARVERQLVRVEELCATRLLLTDASEPEPALRSRLDAAWKTLLLHQFHDILPGSSIGVVFDEARAAFKRLERELASIARLAAGATTKDQAWPLARTTPEHLPEPAHVVDAMGLVELEVDTDESDSVAILRNDHLVVEIHASGDVYLRRRRLVDDDAPLSPLPATDTETALPGDFDAHHRLSLFGDRPRQWDAWNMDFDHVEARVPVTGRSKRAPKAVTKDPRRTTVEVPLLAGTSRLVLHVSLAPGCPVAELELTGPWREDHRLLRAHVTTPIRAQRWTTGTQLGFVERQAHANTAIDEARFEVPGQRWMDVSMPGRGVAVVDACQLGRSAGLGPHDQGGEDGTPRTTRDHAGVTLGLTLLRAPSFPDPGSDRERHHLRYGITLHDGDWRAARIPARAEAFADEPHADAGTHLPEALARGLAHGPFELTAEPAGAVEVLCCKPAEDGPGLILRLAERHGGPARVRLTWARSIAGVRDVDLTERDLDAAREAWLERRPDTRTPFDEPGPLAHAGAETSLELAPHELRTLRIDLD